MGLQRRDKQMGIYCRLPLIELTFLTGDQGNCSALPFAKHLESQASLPSPWDRVAS